ncbi:MAG TPA: hypothetical protein VN258_01255 [Mobilitalea sp.]|nr:hypothetical protein [Mobilitalea sp.]
MLKVKTNCTRPKYVCGNHEIKLIGTTDGLFPDFGHHLEGEMGGLWLHPIKLLDGFWMRVKDIESELVDQIIAADSFENYPHKNVFYYGNGLGHTAIQIKRSQVAPDGIKGILVDYEFINTANTQRHVDIEFIFKTDLRPEWLSEKVGLYDGKQDMCEYLGEKNVFHACDDKNPWHVMVGSSIIPSGYKIGTQFVPEVTKGNGISVKMNFSLAIRESSKQSIQIYIAGSYHSKEECAEQYKAIISARDFTQEKENRMKQENSKAVINVGNPEFESIYEWIKVHKDWLIQSVDGIGRGITAGLPEYPWWFSCDSCYMLQAYLAFGDFELCRDTLKIILDSSIQLNGDGRVIHELLPNGYSPNLGNTQETAQFIIMLWDYYQWTGDREFLSYAYEYCKKSIKWLREQDDDGDFFPSGYGLIEISGLNMEMIDTAVYTCEAYRCYSKIAEIHRDYTSAKEYRLLFEEVKVAINNCLWDEENGLYCDCYASAKAIMSKKQQLLDQFEENGRSNYIIDFEKILEERYKEPDREYGWLLNRNWVINTPMETGIASEDKAHIALQTMHGSEFIGQHGMYLDALNKNAAMTISTGVMAIAQARYGYPDRSLELIKRMFTAFSKATPGSISEMSPDYGCFVQGWTAYGVVVPIVRYFFGIEPDAEKNIIHIHPCLPDEWKLKKNEKISILDVPVLDGEVSINYYRNSGKEYCDIINTTSAAVVASSCSYMELNIINK